MKYSMEEIFFSILEKMDRKEKNISVEEDTWRMKERERERETLFTVTSIQTLDPNHLCSKNPNSTTGRL